jgi:hypothetical protein
LYVRDDLQEEGGTQMGLTSALTSLMTRFSGKPQPPPYAVDDGYTHLRANLFSKTPGELNLSPAEDEVWGVVLETASQTAAATLVALAEGSVSFYLSGGASLIGLGHHEGPRQAGAAWLATAQDYVTDARPIKEFPLPEPGLTRYFLLTGGGARALAVRSEELLEEGHPLAPLAVRGETLFAEIRLLQDQANAKLRGER